MAAGIFHLFRFNRFAPRLSLRGPVLVRVSSSAALWRRRLRDDRLHLWTVGVGALTQDFEDSCDLVVSRNELDRALVPPAQQVPPQPFGGPCGDFVPRRYVAAIADKAAMHIHGFDDALGGNAEAVLGIMKVGQFLSPWS